ncbi:conserved hypothetical protein [Candidatus Sulfobium mesophilum]|uniref:Uncharacterized protein n=1 Tax=Candidatus Sulfobium mesophilum TaxID=2016548 RepID=A0A2U3QHJ7_9BACT|nr:conserved hypothetical protein [Candidatus Sulfobium mesophilum]
MDIVLDNMEVRILGCLIEKEIATPEYYPLSLNALTNACNQKSNRRPVLSVDESTVLQGIDGLRQKGLARETQTSGSRVPKYLHELLSRFDLSRPETAIVCELMVRGPQTPGELRSNAERMAPFKTIEEVEEALGALMQHDPPLVTKLPREAGRKESRYAHLFSPQATDEETVTDMPAMYKQGIPESEAIARLAEEISQIRRELEELRQAFAQFKSQF